ncbi:MAG: hypothetical protein E7618_03645 [Ruminococcaceae bacterium]|nr:hypothetical protein [Oscillospiraceae bacterium]
MNKSHLMPEAGRRFRQIRKISRFLSVILLSALVLSFLGYSTVAEHWEMPPDSQPPDTPDTIPSLPNRDELEAGAEEIPKEFRPLFFQSEYPLALGIYDRLFLEKEGTIPVGELKIVKTDLSKNPSPGTVHLQNNTTYAIDISSFLTAEDLTLTSPTKPASPEDPPLVLIYHTHGTEGYAEEGRLSYSPSALPRSRDIENNVVAVGKVLTEALNRNGIKAIHCETMHDATSYNAAYTNSAQTVREYCNKYPSIRYAFDIHRDALVGTTEVYKTITYDESTPIAQIMLVVGSDAAGAVHPNWRDNLTFAVNTQHILTERLPTFVRPITLKNASFNQQYSPYGLLIEVGTCVNTLAEAKASAEILGEMLAALITAQGDV